MTVDITSSITSIYCSNYSCIVRFVTVIVSGVLIPNKCIRDLYRVFVGTEGGHKHWPVVSSQILMYKYIFCR